MPLPRPLQEQLDELAFFTDRHERIEALIDLGRGFINPPADEVPRTEAARVPGCESEVYFRATRRDDGTLNIRYAVDNPQGISAMALAVILQTGLTGVPVAEITTLSDDLVYSIFGRELSMGKSMGLMGMVRMAKVAAS